MFLLSPEADMRPGDLQAQVFMEKRVLLADNPGRPRLSEGFLGIVRSCRNSGTLAAQGLSQNDRETMVFHSPTVSRHWIVKI
jgi:hypothetical protein